MKALLWKSYGAPSSLVLGEAEVPAPKKGQVLIRVRATGLNAADLHLLRADPFPVRFFAGLTRPHFLALGADVAGTVEALGPGANRFQVGDAVFGDLSGGGWSGLAEFTTAAEASLTPMPAHLLWEEAAAVPMAGVTALQALRNHGKLQGGEKVLIHGASGGVGTFAVQIAKALGADVTALCSPRNTELVKSLGADRVVDYTKEDLGSLEGPFDLIHVVNGDRPLSDYGRALAPRGRLVISGGSMRQLTQVMVQGPWLSLGPQKFTAMTAGANPADLAVLSEYLVAGRIRPILDRVFPLDQGIAALEYLEEGHARGKVVVRLT